MTDAELDQVRRNGALLHSIVSRQVKLEKSGRDWKGLCPFHTEKTPSFTVFEDGHYHCFGCAAHGTSLDYLMQTEHIEFREAVARIEAENGVAPAQQRKLNGASLSDGAHHGDVWQPIMPPPVDAPPPTDAQLRCDMLHEYLDADDQLLSYVRRHEARGAKRKVFVPLTFGVLNGKRGWHDKAPDTPRPLYGLDRLSHAVPDATVILCEGEKKADAVQRMFPYVGMSWMGGANAVAGTDFSPLHGRSVITWGDADAIGLAAMAAVAKRIPIAATVDTEGLPDGFDAWDLEQEGCDDPEGWLRDRLKLKPEREPDGKAEPEPEAKPAELFGPPTLADLTIADLAAMDEITFGRILKAKAALLNVTPTALTKARSAEKTKIAKAARDAERAAKDAANAAEKAARAREKAAKANAAAEAKAAAAAAKDKADKQAEANGPVDQLLAEFNAKYFVVNESGRAVIYEPRHDPILNRQLFERLSFADLERLYCNRLVKIGEEEGKPVYRQAAKVWLRHPDRKQFIGGVVFDPSPRKHPDDVHNLWGGFPVTPAPGSWALLKEHIRTVICRNKTDIFNYLLDWMADVFQNPGKQAEACVVLCGEEGSGKGILARAIKHLLGQHGLAISNSKHLTGNFNSHLRDCIFLFADEAFYAGDKQHIGILKALVTEDTITIEGKYQNAIQSPNFLHIMMASNETWVVPASLRSRRWLVLDVDDSRANDHTYFAAIQDELDNGGHAAMLDELLARVPFGNLRNVPVTAALQTQRKLSLPAAENWWFECLHRGFVYQSRHGLEDHFGQWHDFMATEILFASYIQYCQAHHERHPLPRELFGSWIQSGGARPRQRRNQAVGEHIVDATTSDGRSSRTAEVIFGTKPHGYVLGDLSAARAAFSAASGLGAIDWGTEEEG